MSPSEKSKNKYFNVSLCDPHYRVNRFSALAKLGKETHEEKRLHPVLVSDRHLIDIDDRGITPTRNLAVFLDCLKYGPAVIAVALITCQPERDKERFNSLRSAVQKKNDFKFVSIEKKEAYRSMYRAS